jgi:chromosome segregation ATPase
MKVRESALRLKRFEAEEKAQKASSLEQMVREFEQMAMDLERQIQAEEERTGVRDSTHFAYSTFARSAAQRRENLLASISDLQAKLDTAIVERDDLLAELEQVDAVQQRDDERMHSHNLRSEPLHASGS